MLVLPLGLMYGRVPPSAAAELVAAAESGEVMTALLRGRVGLPPAAQAALGFAHQQLALPRCRDVSLVSTTPVDGGSVLVRISTRTVISTSPWTENASMRPGSPAPSPGRAGSSPTVPQRSSLSTTSERAVKFRAPARR